MSATLGTGRHRQVDSPRGGSLPRASLPSSRRALGFTLIELLVIVGILALVIAMLMPALAKARRQARTTACLSHLRDVHSAYAVYVTQNGYHSLMHSPTGGTVWMNTLRPLAAPDLNVWLCPEASAKSYGWGDAGKTWGPFDAARGSSASMRFLGENFSSYGFNGWLYTDIDDPGAHHPRPYSHDAAYIPLFADSNWLDAWPSLTDAAPANAQTGASPDGPQLGRFWLARHDGSVNVVFLDGHAAWQRTPDDLRKLKWFRNSMVRG